MSDIGLTVAIMAYNRPDHLRNCALSVFRHAPQARVLIVDDDSEDPRQIALLAELGADPRVRVVGGVAARARHGGLYPNMQRALELCETDLLLFLQDDTQLVRPIDPEDLATVRSALAQPGIGFVYPFFLKWHSVFRARLALRAGPVPRTYVARGPWRRKPRHQFSDLCIVHAPALRARGWRFVAGEAENGRKAAGMFVSMVFMADPVGFYCPAVTTIYRAREKSRDSATTTHPSIVSLVDLDAAQIAWLRGRSLSILPVAEDSLSTAPVQLTRPYSAARDRQPLYKRLSYRVYAGWLRAIGAWLKRL